MTLTDWLGPQEWQAVRLSLRVAGVAMLASLPFAVTVAWLLAYLRARPFVISCFWTYKI